MNDPDRLAKGEGELARLLASAEDDVLDDAAVDRVRSGLVAAGALGAGAGASAAASTAKAGGVLKAIFGATSAKIATAVVVGTVAAAGGYHYVARLHAPPPAVAPEASAIVERPVVPVVTTAARIVPVAPPPETAAPRVERVAAPPAMTAKPTPSSEPAAEPSPREGLLLLQARQAMSKDPQRALDLVRQHEKEFPQSQLVPERTKLKREAIAAGAQ